MAQSSVFWITVANLLYLASYSVKDILWLRILSVAAMVLLIPYYMMQPTPLMAPIYWNLLFIAINMYWIVRLLIERRPVHFTPDEAHLKELVFPSLTPQETRNFFALGAWEDLPAGASVVQHDEKTNRVSLIARGVAAVIRRGVTVYELGEGQFVGDIEQNAKKLEIDVVAREPMCVLCFPCAQLDAYTAKRPDVDLALERSVGFELRRELAQALSKLS